MFVLTCIAIVDSIAFIILSYIIIILFITSVLVIFVLSLFRSCWDKTRFGLLRLPLIPKSTIFLFCIFLDSFEISLKNHNLFSVSHFYSSYRLQIQRNLNIWSLDLAATYI